MTTWRKKLADPDRPEERMTRSGHAGGAGPVTEGSRAGNSVWIYVARGPDASALLYSLVETLKANGPDPWAYLRHIFERLPTATDLDDHEALLPWNVTLSMA